MSCPHSLIIASLDRWEEAHWHIHQLEANYHKEGPFRYSFNSFIRSIKEVPDIINMELQNHSDFQTIFKPIIRKLRDEPFFKVISKKRDFVVHRGKLEALSHGQIGVTEGRGWKLGAKFEIPAFENSDDAYKRYLDRCREDQMFRELLGPDCDSWPMLRREWKIEEFPDMDLLDVAFSTWKSLTTKLSDIVIHLGGESLSSDLPCCHDPEAIRCKQFSADHFLEYVGETA